MGTLNKVESSQLAVSGGATEDIATPKYKKSTGQAYVTLLRDVTDIIQEMEDDEDVSKEDIRDIMGEYGIYAEEDEDGNKTGRYLQHYEHSLGTSDTRFYNKLYSPKLQISKIELGGVLAIAQQRLLQDAGDSILKRKDGKNTKGDVDFPSDKYDLNQCLENVAIDAMHEFLKSKLQDEIDDEENEQRIKRLEDIKDKLTNTKTKTETVKPSQNSYSL